MLTARIVIKALCAIMSMVHMVGMAAAHKKGDTNAMVSCGFWAVIMTMLWKL